MVVISRGARIPNLSSLMVLSHWPHVAEQVQQQVAELVSECERTRTQVRQLVAESFHTSHMCGNKLRASAASSIFRRHEGGSLCCGMHSYSLPIRKWNSQ